MDLKVGARMMLEYPGLSLVGTLAMAFAIGAGAAGFEVVKRAVAPDLPLPEGARVVGFKFIDRAQSDPKPLSAHDYFELREHVRTVQDLGAARTKQANLMGEGLVAEPVAVTEITASAFRVARASPLLGRMLVETDEAPGASSISRCRRAARSSP